MFHPTADRVVWSFLRARDPIGGLQQMLTRNNRASEIYSAPGGLLAF
jgi:hypothetical protein